MMTPMADLSGGAWIGARATREAGTIGYFVPASAPVVLRVLHRVEDLETGELLRWAQVVDTTPLEDDPGAQFHNLPAMYEPRTLTRGFGALDADQHDGLVTGAKDAGVDEAIFVGVWEGSSAVPRAWEGAPLFAGAGRDCYVVRTSLDELRLAAISPTSPLDMPYCWWSSDTSIFVTTDVDLDSTYVATTETIAADLLRLPILEIVRVSRSCSIVT